MPIEHYLPPAPWNQMQPFRFDPTFQISTNLHRDSANLEDAMAGEHYANVTTCVNFAEQTKADREVKFAAMLLVAGRNCIRYKHWAHGMDHTAGAASGGTG